MQVKQKMSFIFQKISVVIFVIISSIVIYGQNDTVQTNVQSLKDVYANDFYIGCLLSYAHVGFPTDPYVPGQSNIAVPNGGYLIKYHMNSMSPGNWMKPTYIVDISGSASAYNAAGSQIEKDSIDVHPIVNFNGNIIAQLNWAQRQGFTFRGHTLVWHNQTPGTAFFRTGFSASGAYLSKEKMTQRMDNFIKEVIRILHEGWPGLLSAMDVVNEAITDDGLDRSTNNEWYTVYGDLSYIMEAFVSARKHTAAYGETQIKLYYNDYNTHIASKADGIVRLCQPIFEAGYLDGIGMQDHDQLTSPTAEQWIASYNKFDPICNEMAVTEIDVSTGSGTNTPSSVILTNQANQYGQLFKCFVERSYFSGRGKIINVSKDGLNDEWTFVKNQSSSLWDSQNQCKPAFYAVANVGINYNILDSLITYADTLNESKYTHESWLNFTNSLSSAKIVKEKNYSTNLSAADSLVEAKNSLDSAIENLVTFIELEALKPVIIEAESGAVGANYSILEDGSISYVSIQSDLINGGNPGSPDRIISYEVTFPDTGVYNLFVKVRVGANTFNDDSFFYGNGFGEKDFSNDDEWILSNGLAAAGFSNPDDIVYESGGVGSGVWKWVNLSQNAYQGEQGVVFNIDGGGFTKTFQIGAREDGLDIDKIVFGKSELYFTVNNLNNGEPGSVELPDTIEIWQGPPLAFEKPKFLGNIYSSSQLGNFTSFWNQVTPENAGKWGSVEGSRDVMNWGGLDAAYNLAKDNGFPFNFHVLIWGAQQPTWINSLQPEEQLAEIREWFQAVADRYPDIEYLQVVNEALPTHNPPDGVNGRANYKEALGGDGDTGWDWVLNAFRMAREIFPASTKLLINDYGIVGSASGTSQYLQIIRLLQSENLIDIIGVQGHAFSTRGTAASMISTLDSLSSTGLRIQVTEMDIDGPSDEIQLQDYQRIFPALWEHHGVEGIILWGWKPGLWRNDQGAYLIQSDGTERPALVWLRDFVKNTEVTVEVKTGFDLPVDFYLGNNYPNPFNPSTKIEFSVSKYSNVILDIYDPLGRLIRSLVNENLNAGNYSVTFDAHSLSSGVYYYRISAGEFTQIKKMVLIK